MVMGNFDREMAKRVWQRVQAAQPDIPSLPTQPAGQLQHWILEEWQTCQRYIILQRQLQDSQLLQGLIQQKRAQISCLKGIYRLVAEKQPKVVGVAPKQEPPAVLLRKCYGTLMRCLAQYEAMSRDPEYGSAYAQLAQENKRQCHSILRLLGENKL